MRNPTSPKTTGASNEEGAATTAQKNSERRFKQPFTLTPQYFGSLLFDRIGVRYLPFDEEATQLLIRLTTQSVGELVANTEEKAKREQIEGFYFHLQPHGLFDQNGFAQLDVIDIEPPPDHLAAPLVTHVEVIGACNITCSHCFAGELPRNQNPLTLKELDDLFVELASLGCFRVSLTGGEPLMRNDIFEIIDSAERNGLAVSLATNGMLVDEQMAIKLGKRKSIRLTVSLDGATAESNDAVRGKGVFAKVAKGLEILRKHTSYAIGFTITRGVASEVQQCVETAKELGANAVVFRPLYPTGVALQNPDLMPTFEQYTDAILEIAGEATLEEDVTELESQCGAGELLAGISVQGEVNPCSFLGSGFVSGNIRQSSFKEIWNEGQQFKKLREFADGIENQPKDSGCGKTFEGGCRCRSIDAFGDVNASDPWHAEYQANPDKFFFPLKNLVVRDE